MKAFVSLLAASLFALAIAGCATEVTCVTTKKGQETCTSRVKPW